MSKKTFYLILTISGLILIVMIGCFVHFKPCLSNGEYYFYKIILAAAISAFGATIPGLLTVKFAAGSFAKGALALFVIVFFFTPKIPAVKDYCSQPLTLIIEVQDELGKHPIINIGRLRLVSDEYMNTSYINENGMSVFTKIPAKLIDSRIRVQIEGTRYYFSNHKSETTVIVKNGNAVLLVEPDNSLCCVSGYVRSKLTNSKVAGVIVSIRDFTDTTDVNGRFTINIPLKSQDTVYKTTFEKAGYVLKVVDVYPGRKDEAEIEIDSIIQKRHVAK